MSNKLAFICSVCNFPRHNMVLKQKSTGLRVCLKCYRKRAVTLRPSKMGWREAFGNLLKYGTMRPKENIEPERNKPVVIEG